MASSRDPEELKDLWMGWHQIGAPMRQRYSRFVELSNQGAREMGFKDTGAMWRAGYDMTPDEFSADLERLWQQVRPLYLSLHTYVRAKLVEKYGPSVVPPTARSPRTCSAIPGRRSGATSSRWSLRRRQKQPTTSPNC